MGGIHSSENSEEEYDSAFSSQDLIRQLESISRSRAVDRQEPSTSSQVQDNGPRVYSLVRQMINNNQLGVRSLNALHRSSDERMSTEEDVYSETSSSDDEDEDFASTTNRPVAQSFVVAETKEYRRSYDELHADIATRCGFPLRVDSIDQPKKPRTLNLLLTLQRRELAWNHGKRHFFASTREQSSGFTGAEKININTGFFPNRRRCMAAIRAKTFCIAYTDNGNGLMTASQDHKIRLYEKHGPRRQYFLNRALDVPYVGWSILDVAVSPDGRDLVYSTWNEALYQCSIDDLDENWIPLRVEANEARFALFSIRFNKSGTEIVAGSTDQHLYIYDRERCGCVLTLKVHDDDVNAVCFGDESSNIILSGADDGLVKVWDRREMGEFGQARPIGIFAGHRDGITFIDSRGDDRYILSNSKDQTIKLWDLRHFASDAGIESTKKSVRMQKWDYRWQCSPQENLRTQRLDGDCSIVTLRGHSVLHTLIRARFSPDHTGKRYIYTGCGRGNCVVYDIYTGETKHIFRGHRSVVRDCAWSPIEDEVATASWDGTCALWRFDERKQRNINPEDGSITGDEDSSDESYRPLDSRYGGRKRKNRSSTDADKFRKTRNR
ncbi:Transcription initiation factor IIE subunit alpha [Aphelenchoides besseyi]|nr:Transcription initiation factor IIE subunit alpha [Aphelenchoides besseyi]KAI6207683.1 Transcription initiation factor IIE subunit alpha [Aphelenchoides besseyi]